VKKIATFFFFFFVLLGNTCGWIAISNQNNICVCDDDKNEIKEGKAKLKDCIGGDETMLNTVFSPNCRPIIPFTELLSKGSPGKQLQPPEYYC